VLDYRFDHHGKNAYQIMRGGRARWKIENETFNTLKNQGYNFEHNYGLGKKNLSVVFGYAHDAGLPGRSSSTTLLCVISVRLEKAGKQESVVGKHESFF